LTGSAELLLIGQVAATGCSFRRAVLWRTSFPDGAVPGWLLPSGSPVPLGYRGSVSGTRSRAVAVGSRRVHSQDDKYDSRGQRSDGDAERRKAGCFAVDVPLRVVPKADGRNQADDAAEEGNGAKSEAHEFFLGAGNLQAQRYYQADYPADNADENQNSCGRRAGS
jgi:hypothetical protein